MPETITVTVYTFDELADDVKSRVLDRYRYTWLEDFDWWDTVYEDAVRMAAILGIEIGMNARKEIDIYSGGEQGDRATFAGVYTPVEDGDIVAMIKAEAPQDTELHRIAENLRVAHVTGMVLNSSKFFATITHRGGHARHMSVSVADLNDDGSDAYDYPDVSDAIEQAMRDFADWIHAQLEAEQEYLTGDEHVAETIRANEWRFEEDGVRVDARKTQP